MTITIIDSYSVQYWQVEVQNQQTKGDVIKWEDQIKLRHVTTQKYLTASRSSDGTSVLRLQQDGDDERDSVFRMHAVIKEQDAIELGTYTRIERMSDGTEPLLILTSTNDCIRSLGPRPQGHHHSPRQFKPCELLAYRQRAVSQDGCHPVGRCHSVRGHCHA